MAPEGALRGTGFPGLWRAVASRICSNFSTQLLRLSFLFNNLWVSSPSITSSQCGVMTPGLRFLPSTRSPGPACPAPGPRFRLQPRFRPALSDPRDPQVGCGQFYGPMGQLRSFPPLYLKRSFQPVLSCRIGSNLGRFLSQSWVLKLQAPPASAPARNAGLNTPHSS